MDILNNIIAYNASNEKANLLMADAFEQLDVFLSFLCKMPGRNSRLLFGQTSVQVSVLCDDAILIDEGLHSTLLVV